MENVGKLVVKTSTDDWVVKVANAYKAKLGFQLIDDAHIGINPISDTLLDMGKKANLSQREWIALLVALGVSAFGAFLLVMAILDPEPYSKIAFALGTGAVLIGSGGYSAIRILVGHKPPNIKMSRDGGFEISW